MEDLLDEEISRPKPERRVGAAQVRTCGQGKGSETGWAIDSRAVFGADPEDLQGSGWSLVEW